MPRAKYPSQISPIFRANNPKCRHSGSGRPHVHGTGNMGFSGSSLGRSDPVSSASNVGASLGSGASFSRGCMVCESDRVSSGMQGSLLRGHRRTLGAVDRPALPPNVGHDLDHPGLLALSPFRHRQTLARSCLGILASEWLGHHDRRRVRWTVRPDHPLDLPFLDLSHGIHSAPSSH